MDVPSDLILTNVVAIAGGAGQSLALRADGTVTVWGYDGFGQAEVPPDLEDAVAITAGDFHNLALKSDGTVVAWGDNTYGQTTVPADVTNVVGIAAGFGHSLALRADGTVMAWGFNGASQAGPTNVPPGLSNVVAIASGESHCLALKADGTIIAWGNNFNQQTNVPSGLTNVVAITAGGGHNLALKADGTAVGWGDDSSGESDVPLGLSNVVAIAAGNAHSLALKADGTLVAWGAGTVFDPSSGVDYGQSLVPADLVNVAAIAGGMFQSLALRADGPPFLTSLLAKRTVVHGSTTWLRISATGAEPLSYQWRFNGTNLPGATNAVLELDNVQFNQAGTYSVVVSNGFGTATSPDTELDVAPFFITAQPQSQATLPGWTVGFNVAATGSGPFSYQWQFNNTDIAGATGRTLVLTNVQAKQLGVYAVIVSNTAGTARSSDATLSLTQIAVWGDNAFGQKNVPAGLTNVAGIAGGFGHCLALKLDGTVVAWGNNNFGQTNVPPGLTNITAVAAGNQHSLALKADGTVITWGYAANPPSDLTNVVEIAAGALHSLALKKDSTVVAWGLDSANQTDVPLGLTNVVAIRGGNTYSLALKADGTVALWGVINGKLNPSRPGPTNPPPLTNIVAIAGGRDHYLALKADGTVAARGDDRYGEADVPSGLSNVVAIAAGAYHSMAVKSDGSVVAWGAGKGGGFPRPGPPAPPNFGQSTVPTNLTDVAAIAAGGYNSLALVGGGPPVLATPLVDRSVVAGATAYLRVAAVGALPLSYQWRFNGADLPGATNAVLVLNNAQFGKAGLYSVLVINSFGVVTSPSVTLGVAPLFITSQPRSVSTFRGATVTLSVTATGPKPFSFQWHLNGSDLSGATNDILVLTNVQINQAGQYSVTVNNALGSATSAPANVSVGLVAGWGDNSYGQTNLPPALSNVIAIAAGGRHNLALKPDGTVVAWGANYLGQTNVPSDLANVIAIAAGGNHSLALRADGTLVGWGDNSSGQTDLSGGLANVVAIAAGAGHSLALMADGTVAASGYDYYGQIEVPIDLTDVVAIAAGAEHSLALKADGTVVAWGDISNVPSNLSHVVAISGGGEHSLALKADGTVVVWGDNSNGQTDLPSGLSNVVAISAGGFHSLALKADGSVAVWGAQSNLPISLTNVIAISAGGAHSLALLGDAPPELYAPLENPAWSTHGFSLSLPSRSGKVYLLEYKDSANDSSWAALPLVTGTGSGQTLLDPTANGPQRFYRVRQW